MHVRQVVSYFTVRVVPASIPVIVIFLSLYSGAASAQARDLTVQLQQVPANPVLTGHAVAYDVTTSNLGTNRSRATVLITLPDRFTAVTATPNVTSQFICDKLSPSVVSCTRRRLIGPDKVRISALAPRALEGGGVIPTGSNTFTVTAEVDPDQEVNESIELNNLHSISTRVETAADLDPDVQGSSAIAETGRDVTYILRLRNSGDRGTAVVNVRGTLPQQVDFVRVEQVPGQQFGANACVRFGQDITCKATSTTPGQTLAARIIGRVINGVAEGSLIHFDVTADPSNSIREHDEYNNTAVMISTVRSVSDLRITGTVTKSAAPCCARATPFLRWPPPETPLPATLVTLRLTVTNTGAGTSAPTTVHVAWPAAFHNAHDLECPPGTHLNEEGQCVEPGISNCFDSCVVNSLFPGTSQVVTTFAVVENFLRSYEIVATVDPEDTVLESRDNNNVTGMVVDIPW